ncbi:MAG: MFS transporter [Chloroflexota bacterium]
MLQTRPIWWGGLSHRIYTVIVFIILASLDNAARAVFPPLYAVISADLQVPESWLGFISAVTIIVVAATSLLWGFWGDRNSRKALLLYGTLIWSLAMLMISMATSYTQLLIFQLITAIGIGCIASIGFSVVNDLIPPRRRGLLLSFWGLSQAGGGGFGALTGSMLGASNWRLPFAVVSMAGFGFAFLYFLSYEPRRGQSEPELAHIFEAGERYGRRIRLSDIRQILAIRSNRWLILQGLMSTIAYGSLVWMPRLFISRLEALGYSLETATVSGNLLAVLFQLGLYGAVFGGLWGDWWQQRNPSARAWICTISALVGMPILTSFFFIPLPEFYLPADASTVTLVQHTLMSPFTNPWVGAAFLISMLSFATLALDNPNRSALLSDLNQPEHRSTIAGFSTLLLGVGLGLGSGLAGVAQTVLTSWFLPPWNYALGLALFQLFFLPAGYFYYLATRSTPGDLANARAILKRRGEQNLEERMADESTLVTTGT